MTARAFAALAFLASLLFVVLAHLRLRERARREEADGLLREAFDRLERTEPPDDRAPRSG